MSFSDILRKGKRRTLVKDSKGTWDRCESCTERKKLFTYKDKSYHNWLLCEKCIDTLLAAEGDEP